MAACSIEGCVKPVAARGWCTTHYARWQRHGDPSILKLARGPSTCSVDGCERKHDSKGYCAVHYMTWRRHGDPLYEPAVQPRRCSEEGCERKHRAHGLCAMHRKRQLKHGSAKIVLPQGGPKTQSVCSVAHCDKPAQARHLCSMHYMRWNTHGDPSINKRLEPASRRAALDWRRLEDVEQINWRPAGNGYRFGTWPEHPNANVRKMIAHHTAVMAAVLGRPLMVGESVHHKNGVRHDNRPENLELWANAHRPGQRVSELIAFAHEILDRYADDMQLWPEHLRP